MNDELVKISVSRRTARMLEIYRGLDDWGQDVMLRAAQLFTDSYRRELTPQEQSDLAVLRTGRVPPEWYLDEQKKDFKRA